MKISISPIAKLPTRAATTASVAGDVLTVDGVDYDLSAVPEGGEASPEGDHPFIGPITRSGGEIACTIRWRYAGGGSVSVNGPLTVTDGAVPNPIVRS